MNPVLPLHLYIPDVEARQWKDGRMYMYGSYDINGDTDYCSYEYHVFSSENLVDWEDHGISFTSKQPDTEITWTESRLYAPDCIYRDGIYYLFFCLADNSEGVATSLSPSGPFINPVPVEGADGDAIDPAIFLDDDGQAYYYWGQFHCRGAKLKPDLTGIDPSTLNTSLIHEAEHGFHEGASVRKRNGIYYLVYTDTSRGKATSLSYATSSSPLGPFVKRGIIIDNDGCDPCTWNNHGSIAVFNGDWYIFYHRSSQASKFNRRVCIEPIFFDEDGMIQEVEMTTQGVSGPIQAVDVIEAYRACALSGTVCTQVVEPKAQANGWSEHLTSIENGCMAVYKYINFEQDITMFEAQVASYTYGGSIEVRIDHLDGQLLGECRVKHTGGWQKWERVRCQVSKVSGIHALYLVFRGSEGRLMNLNNFRFL